MIGKHNGRRNKGDPYSEYDCFPFCALNGITNGAAMCVCIYYRCNGDYTVIFQTELMYI